MDFPYWGVGDGNEVRLGELLMRVLRTPRSTPEHVSYVVYDTGRGLELPLLEFTDGDLLVGVVGLPEADRRQQQGGLVHLTKPR